MIVIQFTTSSEYCSDVLHRHVSNALMSYERGAIAVPEYLVWDKATRHTLLVQSDIANAGRALTDYFKVFTPGQISLIDSDTSPQTVKDHLPTSKMPGKELGGVITLGINLG